MERFFIGINWGSTNFRALKISTTGDVLDSFASPSGVTTLDREGLAAMATKIAHHWPGAEMSFACGMIGSGVGWVDAGYCMCPSTPDQLARTAVKTKIGELDVRVVPGMSFVDQAGNCDVMRGEEVEVLGLINACP